MLTLRKIKIFNIIALQKSYAKAATPATPVVKALGKKLGKVQGNVAEKKIMPVEMDPNKLVNQVCGSNYFVQGEDVKLKPDSEYPDWLWNLNTGPPKTLDELDPNTKEYWKKLRQMSLRRNLTLLKTKKF